MRFAHPESVQGLQKVGKNAKTDASILVSRVFVTEYPDQERFFNIFPAIS